MWVRLASGIVVLALALGVAFREDGAGPSDVTSVGIAKRGSDSGFARGVLVERDIVLTARHATHVHRGQSLRYEPNALEIHIDVDGTRRVHPVMAFEYTSDRLDFALLRIGPDADGRLPPESAVHTLSSDRVPAGATLRTGLEAEVRVVLPFEATSAEVERLKAETPRHADAIDRSYRHAGPDRYALVSLRWAQPTLGVECRAAEGESGAPFFDASGRVAGILFAGDEATEGPSGWSHHDALLPAAAIVAELRAHDV